MAQVQRLVGVYDADGGLRGELAYLAGKLGGRHCSLCDITHSPIRRRRAWDDYVASLPVPFDVVHRNERSPEVRLATEGLEPCVVAVMDDGSVVMLLDDSDLVRARDVSGLAASVTSAAASACLAWPSQYPSGKPVVAER